MAFQLLPMIFRKRTRRFPFLLIFILSVSLYSCTKQEKVWQFNIVDQKPPPPPATGKDTIISVTALLNNDTFKALGRAEAPSGKLSITFVDLHSTARLKLDLGADTPGVYPMSRDIATHTALWYNAEGISFTSRATEDAGGTVTISEIDTVNHRLKGHFDLLLTSRTDSSRYSFEEGAFDILYNHAVMTIDDKFQEIKPIDETTKTLALSSGTEASPLPVFILAVNDSLKLTMKFLNYDGIRKYDITEADKIKITLQNTKTGKMFTADAGAITLIRFNYKEFAQLLFDCQLKADDGERRKISNGSVVIGM